MKNLDLVIEIEGETNVAIAVTNLQNYDLKDELVRLSIIAAIEDAIALANA